MKKIAVLISGTGTNLKNLAEECKNNLKDKCEIAIVISNKEDVQGLNIANNFGNKTLVLPNFKKKFSISSNNVNDYNLFISLKTKAEECFINIQAALKNESFHYSFFNLIENCQETILSSYGFIEDEIREFVIEKAFKQAILQNIKTSKLTTEEVEIKVQLYLSNFDDEIKEISNFYAYLLNNPSLNNFLLREKYDQILSHVLKQEKIDYIFLAGFMHILSSSFTRQWKNKIINIHPSLLPSFGGSRAVKDALNYGVKITGVTVHFVDEGVDSGKIIAQQALEISPNETEETLHQKIKLIEKTLYPKVLNDLINNKI